MNKKILLPALLVPTLLLLIPFAAMLLKADGWAWTVFDFAACWILTASAVFAYTFITSRAGNVAYRVAAGVGLATGFILVWINVAVGLIGGDENPANLMYGGVLLVGAIGAAIARLEPMGMARALVATALAQFLVPVVALITSPSEFSPGVLAVFGLNFIFVILFAASAVLFWHAGSKPGQGSMSVHA